MAEEVENTGPSIPQQRAKVLGEILDVVLSEQERAIVDSFTRYPAMSSIAPYLTQIVNDGKIGSKDADRISEFVFDWGTDNQGSPLPQSLIFIQEVLIKRIAGDTSILNAGQQTDHQAGFQGQEPRRAPVYEAPIVDEENLPSYLPKIHNVIEAEVRRRVKEEMKAHSELKKQYDELKKRFNDITKMFNGV